MWTLRPWPARPSALPGGSQAKNRKPIGNLGHAPKFVTIGNLGNDLDFRTIGNLGNALDFVNIGILGNCSDIAKIANDFGWQHASGGGEGAKPSVIGNIGKIVIMFQLAKPYTNKPLQYRINDKIANSPVIVL